MVKVVIIGGGWGGCAAALTARKAGAEVVLLERTDMLLGCGLVGGIMRNNGRYTASEELKYLGAGELIELTDSAARHENITFPGHNHASLYDTTVVEPMVKEMLEKMGVTIRMIARAVDVVMGSEKRISEIILYDDTVVDGDVFIEATGSAGPMGNCLKHGNGCSMCILRCPAFGPRISISSRAGVEDMVGMRGDERHGAFSGSCELNKDALSEDVRGGLEREGVVILPVPEEDITMDKLEAKACQQYALPEYAKNVILLNTGHAKLMMPFYPLEKLRKIPGLERAVYEYPKKGDANSVRYLSRAPRDNAMKVLGIANLLCVGEKSGLFVGHTEAMVTGCLAGHNSVRLGLEMPSLLELPRTLASGDLIAYENECVKTNEGLKKRYTFAGGVYFERMKKLKLYTTDCGIIKERVCRANLENVYEGV